MHITGDLHSRHLVYTRTSYVRVAIVHDHACKVPRTEGSKPAYSVLSHGSICCLHEFSDCFGFALLLQTTNTGLKAWAYCYT